MAVDLLAASRRPLERLLHECSFSQWENIALFLDEGATEAVRWAGGLGFVLEELGISHILDLQAFAPGRSPPAVPESEGLTRGIFLVTNFVWDVEGAVLHAACTYGLTEVALACSVSEEAHACHSHAAHISEETGGRASFAVVSQQLKVSLERMLKIKAQSSSSGRRRFSKPSPSSTSPPSSSSTQTIATEAAPHLAANAVDPTVLVTIKHSPLHVGCFFQASTTITSGGGSSVDVDQPLDSQGQHQKGCSAFSLASPACARVFPLRRCDWEGGGGGGAGAALFAAAAAVEGGGGGGGETRGHVSAEEVPRGERLRYRLLAHTLVEALWDQLLLDVSGGGGVFTLGDTSRLIGTTVAAVAEDLKRVSLERPAPPGFGGEGGADSASSGRGGGFGSDGAGPAARREASVVLIDRNLDVAAAASHGGSLLQRILSSIDRTGTPNSAVPATPSSPEAVAIDWSPSAAAHQQDVGVVLPMLTPGLGLPARAAAVERSGGGSGGGGGGGGEGAGGKPPRLLAMKALSGFPWRAPPSLCHSGGDAGAAAGVVHAMACHGEEEGQAALISALEKCVSDNGCVPPPRKRRGMGSSIMALVTSLARGNPRAGGLSGDRVCFKSRGVLQVALAAMEAHQRTSSLAGSGWSETVAAERVQLRQLRDGSTVDVVMEQLCATLNRAPPMDFSSSSSSPPGGTASLGAGAARTGSSAREALLLALRGVSLAGESIGAQDATSFRKAWISRMLAGGFREGGSGVPAGVAEAVDQIRSRKRERTTAPEPAAESVGTGEVEEAGVLLELEDIARERTQRLREVASSRSFHLKSTAVLRDLGFEPYTFVASATAAAAAAAESASGGGDGSGGDGDGEEGWDDWGEDEAGEGTPGVANDDGGSRTEHTAECDTLVGRLAGLLLDRTRPDVPDLYEAKVVSPASVGLGLLSSGLKKLGRMGGAGGGVHRGRHKQSRMFRGTP
ncbi:hypothetical protein Esi_0028_0118 [Ectocarpus siliculosus]|uniref:Uncharacterized protein n=1 Tax=Ectocarpus siliculosus TaxID=2880 RepID=D8LK34_ECTSI|nr:hypothetical protein Esi_0028_0118 [Ectocarpus siliculosus]|eukprot:CBN74503.1 hypothetical protein Esi_0028_0118 [Ectocarpus siliculosus]